MFCTVEAKRKPLNFNEFRGCIFCFDSLWCHQESNRGHKDFQSFALPTELWHLAFASANVEQIFYLRKYFTKNVYKIFKLYFFTLSLYQF